MYFGHLRSLASLQIGFYFVPNFAQIFMEPVFVISVIWSAHHVDNRKCYGGLGQDHGKNETRNTMRRPSFKTHRRMMRRQRAGPLSSEYPSERPHKPIFKVFVSSLDVSVFYWFRELGHGRKRYIFWVHQKLNKVFSYLHAHLHKYRLDSQKIMRRDWGSKFSTPFLLVSHPLIDIECSIFLKPYPHPRTFYISSDFRSRKAFFQFVCYLPSRVYRQRETHTSDSGQYQL